MPRPSNTAARRSEIVQGLLTVMAREGYDAASVLKIAAAAGLTAGLVHYHFESKQQVLVALVDHLVAVVDARASTRSASAADARGRLHALIDAHLALGDDADLRAVAAWSVVGAEALRQAEVQAVYRAALEHSLARLSELARAAIAVGGVRPGTRRPRLVAAAVLAAIEGAYRIAASAPGLLPEGFAAPMVRQLADALCEVGK